MPVRNLLTDAAAGDFQGMTDIELHKKLNEAIDALRDCRPALQQRKELLELLYHAGMTIRSIQDKINPSNDPAH